MLSVPLVSNTTAYFNPRSREGSDAAARIAAFEQGKFQSTLPRRERQQLLTKIAEVNGISIHAPAKGATSGRNRRRHRGRNFNPRSREGSDVAHHVHRLDGLDISIHAPAKGATRQVCTLRHQFDISIHAPAKGATFRRTCTCFQLYAFQSTLPRRERRGRPSDRGE